MKFDMSKQQEINGRWLATHPVPPARNVPGSVVSANVHINLYQATYRMEVLDVTLDRDGMHGTYEIDGRTCTVLRVNRHADDVLGSYTFEGVVSGRVV